MMIKKMKLPNFKKTAQKGFTLIELLVVIGILGILIAGVLAALDPIEQINRGSDANTKRASTELYGALSRYFAVNQEYPWNVSGATCSVPSGTSSPTVMSGTVGQACIQALITAGEFKSAIADSSANKIVLHRIAGTPVGVPDTFTICWQPISKSETPENAMAKTATGGTWIVGSTDPKFVCLE